MLSKVHPRGNFPWGDNFKKLKELEEIRNFFMKKRNPKKAKEIDKVSKEYEELYELEKYYQKITIYYPFGKNFDITFDEEWVNEERKSVSKKINNLLLKMLLK